MPGAGPTPSQTIGPFFRFGMDWMNAARLVPPGSSGALTLAGQVFDGSGEAVPDAMIEIWQADAAGRLGPTPDGGWTGFGRCLTAADGSFCFTTVKPGPVEADLAPHIDVSIFARGLLQRLVTRIYLPDEPANGDDPVLRSIEDPAVRATLGGGRGRRRRAIRHPPAGRKGDRVLCLLTVACSPRS